MRRWGRVNPSHPEDTALSTAARPRLHRLATRVVSVAATVGCLFGGAAAHAATGIDVSRWQHGASLNWDKVRADGVTFAFIKATEGSNYTNSYFAGDWAATKRVGIYRGAYHFARPSVGSAARQARYFVAQAGTFGGEGVLPPVLDLESDGGLGVTALRRWTKAWLAATEELTGRKPIIYTGPYFWESELGNTQVFSSYPLWIAHYGVSSPRVPGGWSHWTFWQKSQTGRVDGISGAVDINEFNGTRARLAGLAQAATSSADTGTDAGTGTTPAPGTDTGAEAGTGTTPDPEPGTGTPTEPAPAPAPTKTTTTVSLSLSRDTVFAGRDVEISGRLRTSTGRALAGENVHVYRRASGSSTWAKIASPTTSTTGRYVVSFAASGSASFRVGYRGGRRYTESTSRARSLTVRPKARTRPTLAVDHAARRGRTAKLYGHLRTVTGRPVIGKTMHLYERVDGATRWTPVTRTDTLSPTGWYQAYVTPRRTATYKAVFRGGPAFTRSVSELTTVRARQPTR